jgi:hypothetical protein
LQKGISPELKQQKRKIRCLPASGPLAGHGGADYRIGDFCKILKTPPQYSHQVFSVTTSKDEMGFNKTFKRIIVMRYSDLKEGRKRENNVNRGIIYCNGIGLARCWSREK